MERAKIIRKIKNNIHSNFGKVKKKGKIEEKEEKGKEEREKERKDKWEEKRRKWSKQKGQMKFVWNEILKSNKNPTKIQNY